MESERFKKIIGENIKYEKESPYNFCDRWCERCSGEKQMRCLLYQNELEQKLVCIANGKEPDDPEIIAEVLKRQFENEREELEQSMQDDEIAFDDLAGPEFEDIRKHIEFVENNPLDNTAEQFCKKAHEFLEKTFHNKGAVKSEILNDFETIAWYHTLLPSKLHRALCGFHEPACEGDISLNDAVAQFAICKKAIDESIRALRNISQHFLDQRAQILELTALLHNIHSRIVALEESI